MDSGAPEWLTKAEAAKRLGRSPKTVQRLAHSHQITWRPCANGGNGVEYNRADIDRIAQERPRGVSPVVLTAGPPSNGNGHQAGQAIAVASPPREDLDGVPASVTAAVLAIASRVAVSMSTMSTVSSGQYLTLAEASAEKGLSQAYLRRQIVAGTLPAVRDRGWRIRRRRPGDPMTAPKPSAMAELKIAATALAHDLMKPPDASFEERARCRQRTKNLLNSRRLVRQPCERCGAEPVQAHHENYQRPDRVRWVCRRCHDAVHHRGAVLPAKLPENPTHDEFCRWVVVVGLEAVVLLPERRPTPQPPKPYLTVDEAAAYTGLSQAFLKRMIKLGTLSAIKDRGWKIRRKDLEAL